MFMVMTSDETEACEESSHIERISKENIETPKDFQVLFAENLWSENHGRE